MNGLSLNTAQSTVERLLMGIVSQLTLVIKDLENPIVTQTEGQGTQPREPPKGHVDYHLKVGKEHHLQVSRATFGVKTS